VLASLHFSRQPGQALLAIVPREVWVIANFKETQLTHLRPNQPATVRVDAYPHLKFSPERVAWAVPASSRRLVATAGSASALGAQVPAQNHAD
jgi:multidrug resistance efflux pump